MHIPTQRSIFRWIHLIVAIPIFGYIYSPFDKLPGYAPRDSLCVLSCHGLYRIVDVERPCRSTIFFETAGLTRTGAPLKPAFGLNGAVLQRKEDYANSFKQSEVAACAEGG